MATLGVDAGRTPRTGRGRRWPQRSGLSKSTIGRIWKAFDLKPHRADDVQAVHRPAVRGEGRRRRRAVPQPARGGGGAVRGREVPGPGAGPLPAGVADDAGHARDAHPRLRPARHHQPVRRVQHRRRHRDLQRCTAGTAPSSSRSSSPRSTPRSPPTWTVHLICDNYGTHKTPTVKTLAGRAPPVPHALHPDLLLAGSTRSNGGSPTSPTTCSAAASTTASKPSKPTSAPGSRAWNDRPQTVRLDQDRRRDPRNHSDDLCNEFPAQDTSGA